jgi:hypothetical protein
MLPFNPDQYFESNWLKGDIEISKKSQTKAIPLEFLQIEELMQLSEWIDQMTNKERRSKTIFYFIEPKMRFRLWKRRRTETMMFIYHSETKDIYSWEMILNEKNVIEFKGQLDEILLKYPIR